MHGELAQTIALVSYGNEFLRGSKSEPVSELLDSNSTFKWVGSLKFTKVEKAGNVKEESVEVSRRTLGWFSDLQSNHAHRLWLNVVRGKGSSGLPEIPAVSFAGGGSWQIQADFDDHFELWDANWSNTHPEPKIWAVEYKGWRLHKPLVSSHENLNQIWENLVTKIRDARTLADSVKTHEVKDGVPPSEAITYYKKVFEEAEVGAESHNPIPAYHPDMLSPTGYSLKARQVTAAASIAWVFGGMGSWNDLDWIFKSPLQRIQYGRITHGLYDAVIKGFVAATNSFGED